MAKTGCDSTKQYTRAITKKWGSTIFRFLAHADDKSMNLKGRVTDNQDKLERSPNKFSLSKSQVMRSTLINLQSINKQRSEHSPQILFGFPSNFKRKHISLIKRTRNR